MRASFFTIVMSSTVVACGDAGSSTTSALGAADRDEACAEFCDHQAECGATDGGACLAWCGELAMLLRADAARALLGCYLDAACLADDERVCLAEVIEATEPTAAYDDAARRCNDAEARCAVWYGCDVTYYVLLADETLGALGDCFAMSCGEVDPCLLDVLDPR
jgi:hypothetical protein